MINVRKLLLKENRNESVDRGCLMAMIPDNYCKIFNKYNNKLIKDEDLFIKDGEFGREKECHITIRYGFLPDLNELQIRQILKNIKPFMITLTDINKFENEEEGFDVVKYSVKSDVLNQLNSLSGKFPNENKFPDYNAHMTIAYVLPGKFPNEINNLNISVPIYKICYSPAKGAKSYYDL